MLVSRPVLGGPRHVEEDQSGFRGLFQDDLVQPQRRVHAPHVRLIPEGKKKDISEIETF